MALDVIGYPEITELTTLELSSLVITPASVVDVQVNQQDEVQVVITEVVNNITVAEGIDVSISSLDDVPDGVQYAKVVAEVLEEGKVILAEAIGTLDDIRNGTNYAKILASATVDGLITLEEVVGTLDDIAEGVTYGKIKLSALQPGTGFVLTDYLINGTYAVLKAAALDVNGFVVMDNVIDGTYARVKASGLTAEGLVVLDEVVDGTYSKVLTTSVLAGMIKVTELVNDAGDAADLDDLPDGVNYARVASTSISAGKIKLDEGIIDGSTYARVRSTVLEAGKILLAETIAVGGGAATIDDLADGTTYRRIKAVALDVNGLVIASQIQDAGGYTSKILATNVSAGRILLTASNNSGFNANYVAEVSGKYWSPLSDSPAGTGLFITTEYIGFYSAGTWTVRIQNDGGVGKFYVGSGASNYINWDGSTLTIRGSLAVADVAGLGDLATQDAVNWGTAEIANVPARFTAGDTPSASGVYVAPNYIGFYNQPTGTWTVSIKNNSGKGEFFVGGGSNYISWNGSTLAVIGAITASSGSITGVLSMGTSGQILYQSGGYDYLNIVKEGIRCLSFSSGLTTAFGTGLGMHGGTYKSVIEYGYKLTFKDASNNSVAYFDVLDSGNAFNIVGSKNQLGIGVLSGCILSFESVNTNIVFSPASADIDFNACSIGVDSGEKIYLNGLGGGSYLYYNGSSMVVTSATIFNSTITVTGAATFNSTARMSSGQALYFGSSSNNFIKRTDASLYMYYESSNSHRFYVSGVEKFWVHGAGVGVSNTNFSITTNYKILLDAYNGTVYLKSPSANAMQIVASSGIVLSAASTPTTPVASAVYVYSSYLIISCTNLSSVNGSFAIGASAHAGCLLFKSDGVNYKVQGTAI